MQIYEKLKVMRILKGWSQEELAEKLGYSINGYARIERGETDINLTKLEKIAKTMGVDLQQLLGLNEGNVFNLARVARVGCISEAPYTINFLFPRFRDCKRSPIATFSRT